MGRIATAEEEEEIIAQKRHQELVKALQSIPTSNNKEVVDAITKQGEIISTFSNSIIQISSSIKSIPAPKVEMNLSTLSDSITKMSELILSGQDNILAELKTMNALKVWEFDVIKGYSGSIDRVIAKQVIKKPNLYE